MPEITGVSAFLDKKMRANFALKLVGLSGLEPPTPTLSGWCSNLLSYIPLFVVNTKVLCSVGVAHLMFSACATNASPRVVL